MSSVQVKYILTALFAILGTFVSLAQEPVVPDTSIRIIDTTLYFLEGMEHPDSINVDTISTEEVIMGQIKDFVEKDNIIARLLRSFIVFSNPPSSAPAGYFGVIESPYKEHEGKIIRDIHIEVLDVFGASIHDTTKTPSSIVEKTGNWVRINTRPRKIRNLLLFSEGNALEPFALSESERLIRESHHIYDSRISVIEIEGTDSVDVLVKAQDIWSVTAFGDVDFMHKSGYGVVRETNLFGLGHQLENRITISEAYPNRINYSGGYLVPTLWRTFLSGYFHYNNIDTAATHFHSGINRGFITPHLNWGGGINYHYAHTNRFVWDTIPQVVYRPVNVLSQDYWVGRAFTGRNSEGELDHRAQVFAAGRWLRTVYGVKPEEHISRRNNIYNNSLFLFSAGRMFRSFHHDSHIFGFGRREDVPEGSLAVFTAGYEMGEYYMRPYGGFKAASGRFIGDLGYFRVGLETGSFLHNNEPSQGVISAEFFYFTNLISLGNWKVRQYAWNRFAKGYNRRFGEALFLHEGHGIRGFEEGILIPGDEKITFNYEANFFSPWDFFGFRSAFVVFADFGMIGTQNIPLFQSKIYQGYGIGLRVRNEHLVFQTIQVMLGFYPVKPFGEPGFNLITTNRVFYHFDNFHFLMPQVAHF